MKTCHQHPMAQCAALATVPAAGAAAAVPAVPDVPAVASFLAAGAAAADEAVAATAGLPLAPLFSAAGLNRGSPSPAAKSEPDDFGVVAFFGLGVRRPEGLMAVPAGDGCRAVFSTSQPA